MRRFVFAVRRHQGRARLSWQGGPAGREEGQVDLSPVSAAAAGMDLFDDAMCAQNRGLAVGVGRRLPALAGLVLPAPECFALANDLFCCACRIRAANGTLGDRLALTTPTAVSGTDGDGPDHVVRWAGDPQDYPPPSAADLAQLDSGD